jgi:putative DNA methylase
MTYRKKLIEVALPLDAMNAASIREKSLRHGHPSTLHLWWSRKPLATSRAVLFASLIDDPSEHPEQFPTEQEQDAERERLFALIKELVKWENSNDEITLTKVRAEIRKATNNHPPAFLDPFAGGGSIPLEAQRLGLEAHASDLNPVAVLLNKALIELPPQFAGQPPINPEARKTLLNGDWKGARGLAADIRYYGKWMRDEAEKRIGHFYPKAVLPKEHGGGEATVIAWLLVRTVTCPNPACGAQMPLTSKWWLSTKKGNETWVEPIVDSNNKRIKFYIKNGEIDAETDEKVSNGTSFTNEKGKKTKATFKCAVCAAGIAKGEYIDDEANAGCLESIPVAIVAEGKNSKIYLPNDITDTNKIDQQIKEYLTSSPIACLIPSEPARGTFASNAQGRTYGFKSFSDYFTPRQLAALTTFSNLIQEVCEKILSDNDINPSDKQDRSNYANAIATYLAFAIDKSADYWSGICSWHSGRDTIRNTFARQAISMTWDFAEANPFSDSTGNFLGAIEWVAEAIENAPYDVVGDAIQRDAVTTINNIPSPLVSTDPPYYDNVCYADLSDFFYVWLRRSLSSIYPDLFETMLVPKAQELVATPYRFNGSKYAAQKFFETGLQQAFEQMRCVHHPDYPLTVYYAFKQAEADVIDDNEQQEGKKKKAMASTGWETMLEGLMRSGFTITGTWPMRTEMMNRSVGQGTNALASSIVLVCRPRPVDAPIAARRQFINELRAELADALKKMQHGGIAPVDLAQASIGPGMAIYSRYRKVIESDGSPLTVRTALQLINRELDNLLAEQEGEYDIETRWAIAWFEECGMEEGPYGRAELLSKAKNASLKTLEDAGLLEARAGKVRLLRRDEYSSDWRPDANEYLTAWEVMQRMMHALDKHGEEAAGNILGQVPSQYGEIVRDLAYRLYTICERKGWSNDALYYNMIITSWNGISDQARTIASGVTVPQQATLF